MILYRPVAVLQFYKLSSPSSSSSSPKFLSQLKHSYSFLSHSASPSSSSSSSLRIRWFYLTKPPHRKFSAAVSAAAKHGAGGDTFYAEESVSWSSLGVSDKVSRALFNAGLGQPSLVQAATIPSILSGKDVVVAAETGSGKTHGYLVPLIHRLCNGEGGSENVVSQQGESTPPHKFSLVLCPNVTLCEQVVRMANGLCGDAGQPLLTVAAVCGRQGWPVSKPDIIVTTPAALLNNIEPNKRRRVAFLRLVKYVVFDEADMLLCGSFQNKVIRLIHMLRYDEKQLSWSKESTPDFPVQLEFENSSDLNSEDGEDSKDEVIPDEEENFEGVVDDSPEDNDASPAKNRDWRRVRKDYERSKQYIFIAATLPVNGKKTAGAVLKKMFPDANWVSGNYLHRHNPRLKQRWIEVSVDTQVNELLKAVNEGSRSKSSDFGGGQRTIVFANTVDAVEAVAKILHRAGTECYRYHKECSLEERAKTLDDFNEKGGILVSTDAASRGVDIPNISHVIQADFATSVVDFLHRVGRTARAGQYGVVTSFYTESNRDLVAAVRHAGELGQSVETAFSRKRSFRNKLKKRGSGKVTGASTIGESVPSY